MPSYRTRTARKKKGPKKRKKQKGHFTRDPRKLLRWAASGTNKDYEKLRDLAKKARADLPAYIDGVAFDKLASANRTRMMSAMIEELQNAEEHNISGGFLTDALSWLLDKVPFGNWLWPVGAAQGALKAHKGDNLNDVDFEYARLVGASYEGMQERPYVVNHWRRQTQFDSQYCTVWDNLDGHRLIAVRGTRGDRAEDIGQDVLIGLAGTTTNRIGQEMQRIVDATDSHVILDVAAHSLGTALALRAYNSDKALYNRVHETYLFNPSYSPFVRGVADQYEQDENVRYFINMGDMVSLGGIGHKAPANVVFVQPSTLNVGTNHSLAQWQGSGVHHKQYEPPPDHRVYPTHSPLRLAGPQEDEEQFYKKDVVDAELSEGVVNEQGTLDFGSDNFSSILASI